MGEKEEREGMKENLVVMRQEKMPSRQAREKDAVCATLQNMCDIRGNSKQAMRVL